MPIVPAQEKSIQLVLILIDGFSLISYASVIEPLRIANKLQAEIRFDYMNVSVDGNDVTSSCGLTLPVEQALSEHLDGDLVIVCSSDGVENSELTKTFGSILQKFERHGAKLGAVCTGSLILARYKLLRNRCCAIHWEYLDVAREIFPDCNFKSQLFVDDRGLLTASGGISPLDMMIAYIEEVSGKELAARVADIAIHHNCRDGDTPQRMDLPRRIGVPNAHLIRCIELMEQNIEDPLSVPELCREVGISNRQMERLFRRFVNESPHSYYKSLRLVRARDLVLRTTMDIHQISVATGFRSGTHFARTYREKFGLSPSVERYKISMAG